MKRLEAGHWAGDLLDKAMGSGRATMLGQHEMKDMAVAVNGPAKLGPPALYATLHQNLCEVAARAA